MVTEYTHSSASLPESFDGYRIVQLSDLHGKQFGADNDRLISAVARLQPDLIALTGDYIESPDHLAVTAQLIPRLSKIAPVYYISGNHDWASGAIKALRQVITDGGGIYLSNETVSIQKNGQSICLAGVEDPNGRADMIKPDALLEQHSRKHPGSYTLLLAHRNDFITKYPSLNCDLVLTGHGHGGVIRLPVLGGLIGTDRSFFPAYDAGQYEAENYTMIVSRGLGDAPLFPRFLNNPEIVCVTLEKE